MPAVGKTAAQVRTDYDLFLFDLDGTLITSYMEREDKDFHAWEELPGRKITIEALRDLGKKIGIVTNQAGLDYAYVQESDWQHKEWGVQALFGTRTGEIFVCFATEKGDVHKKHPDEPKWDPARRKPSGAMIVEAAKQFNVPLDSTVYIGDFETDEQAAFDAGVDYIDAKEFFA